YIKLPHQQNKDAKSHKTTKRYMLVEKSSASKKPERQIPTGDRFSNKKTTTVPEKTIDPRSCLMWQLTGRILKTVGLGGFPQESTSFNGQKQQRIDVNVDALYNEKQENLRVWLLKLLISKKPVPECSGLVLHQMVSAENNTSGPVPQCSKTFDRSRSSLGLHGNDVCST
ncbi:hypothetical protein Tco_0067653, partial [Tanacetum coccineum]